MSRCLLALVLLLEIAGPLPLSAQKLFDVAALLRLQRISEPQLSPDGKTIAFTVQTVDVEKNSKPKQIWVVPLEGGAARQITTSGTANERPRWTPDSSRIVFISNREGGSQVWSMAADGSDARRITNVSTEASGVVVSPDGKKIVFLSHVYPECGSTTVFDDACNKLRLEAEEKSKVKARVYTSLLYRHWTDWQGKRRQHLLVANIDGSEVKDLTPGNRDVPPFSLGGPDDYAISPDSGEVAYVANTDPVPAISTNHDIYTVSIEGGEPRRITPGAGADSGPLYSPDGKYLAYRSQSRAGYESDRWRLFVSDRQTGRTTNLTENLDRNVQSMTWFPDSSRLFFIVEDRGRHGVQMVPVRGGGARSIITGSTTIDDVQFSPDGKTLVYTESTGAKPAGIYRVSSTGGSPAALTNLNDAVMAEYSLKPFEELWVEGADKTRVHSFVLKPPSFKAGEKYPVLFLIHGGPQGAWSEGWGYRWNPQVFAAQGFVVVMPNPRGSTGYGQKFTDDINSDWGGKVYEDLMAVVDHVAGQPWADADRLAAAGGSYGGYMVNWLLGHSNRFKAFVSHAGVFDLRSMAGETEELWFPLWEFRGMPWDNPDVYQRWSPSFYVKDFKTPTLVIHGELDYRVPVGQGLQLFTALQMQKVPSKLLLFPDEGHWIGKPQNSVLWYNTFLEWITEWTKKVEPSQP